MFHEIANISKTVRFTPREWRRWERLIGVDLRLTWADVVNQALRLFEKDAIERKLLEPYTAYIQGAAPYPAMGDDGSTESGRRAGHPAGQPDNSIMSRIPGQAGAPAELGRDASDHQGEQLNGLAPPRGKTPKADPPAAQHDRTTPPADPVRPISDQRIPCANCSTLHAVDDLDGRNWCLACRLIENSKGTLKRGTEIKPPAKVRKGSQPAKATPANGSRGRAAASKRGAKPRKVVK